MAHTALPMLYRFNDQQINKLYCLLRRRIKGAARAFYSHNVRLDVQRLWDIRCFMNFHIVQEVIRL
jgi:hypothetical protein